MEPVFECKQCGHCCQGRGGIVLARRDLERLATYLDMSQDSIASRYAEKHGGKIKLRPGPDGFCIFFSQDSGCRVHQAKPDVCRAWPFFRGNLEDPVSLELAKDYCPGIRKDAAFSQFSSQGLAWLASKNLLADDEDQDAPNALKVTSLLAAGQRS